MTLSASSSWRGDLLLGVGTLQAELALAPHHEQAGAGDDDGSDRNERGWDFAEEQPAQQKAPDHRRVVERDQERGRRVVMTAGRENVRDTAGDAGADQAGELDLVRPGPAERQRHQAADRDEHREIDDDRRRRFRLRQAAYLNDGDGGTNRIADRKREPDRDRR